ncbi:TetR/AcrR family transcriptional regulator [Actinomadura rudentiformis]|uniref:Helix-turn-helix transcriptional regulator n=1 Tax=Actinomadura rudentiformis TaxID=359158 RepID=A0A6H9Z4P8_9ACTN|nr:helix-turn-helix domain-containing protein [Actinomadura rudentiformis]KAB2352238.1 helix-turn-helix transcriptional regulator [Actinomadura rudentiformis]
MPPPRSAHRPRKTPRQQRAWRTRARILAAAARVFAEHGYASGTTDRIAAQAGLSIGSLYQYFPNKDAILVTLAQAHLDDTIQAARTHLTRPQPLERWLPAVTGALVSPGRTMPGAYDAAHRRLRCAQIGCAWCVAGHRRGAGQRPGG